jgi:hypothetical protein
MDAAIKAEWIAALRSGEYTQGKNLLRDSEDKMCCLGVLCEIAVKHGVIPAPKRYTGEDELGGYQYGTAGEMSFPPSAVWRDWALLADRNPQVPNPNPDEDDDEGLAGLNDNGYTFAQIADLIEKYL